MKAYFDSIEKEVPEQLQQVFLNRRDTAVITIDMHDGHLSTDPDCPCPSPRGREIIKPLNHFMNEARALGLPIIHVRSTLRKGGADEKLFPSAWRMVFPVTVGEIPNIAEHAIEGTRWNRMSIDVHDEDYMVTTKKRLSAFYPTDLELLLRNLGIRRVVLTGCMNSNSGANSASQSHSTSGTASGSGASQTEDRSGWRTGMSVLTEMTEQDENGKLNTITAAVVLDGEGRIRDVQLDELELTVTADDTGKVDLPSDHRTKRQKGEDYPLAAVSSLKAGWAEQVDAFGRWLTGKTADQVRGLELDTDGKAQDADLLSGCTIAVESYRNAVLRACADAREMS